MPKRIKTGVRFPKIVPTICSEGAVDLQMKYWISSIDSKILCGMKMIDNNSPIAKIAVRGKIPYPFTLISFIFN